MTSFFCVLKGLLNTLKFDLEFYTLKISSQFFCAKFYENSFFDWPAKYAIKFKFKNETGRPNQ